jgi:hypothetical protein
MDFVNALTKTMQDLQLNPTWQREALIGQGIDPRDANLMVRDMQEKSESTRMADALRARLDAGEEISPGELLAIGARNPDLARVVLSQMEMQRKAQRDTEKQKFMSQMFGGGEMGGGQVDPAALVAAGATYNDPQLMALGTFFQTQNNRTEDQQRDIEKEERARAFPTPPSGFRYTEDGELEPTPGGEEFIKREKALRLRDRITGLANKILTQTDAIERAVGPVSSSVPTVRASTRDVEVDIARLKSMLTAGNLDMMSGTLSDPDIKILSDIEGGGLDIGRGDAAFIKELEAIAGVGKSSALPEGITPDEWGAMTDEERALWQ